LVVRWGVDQCGEPPYEVEFIRTLHESRSTN
jgi:hypothetical protein